jgi:hypothetical protein
MEQDMDEPEAVKVLRAKHSSGDALPYELRILEYIDSLRAALVEEIAEARRLAAFWEKSSEEWKASRDRNIERAERAESALAAAKEKVERETIERCAKVCDDMSKAVHFNEGLKAAAKAIRALKKGAG